MQNAVQASQRSFEDFPQTISNQQPFSSQSPSSSSPSRRTSSPSPVLHVSYPPSPPPKAPSSPICTSTIRRTAPARPPLTRLPNMPGFLSVFVPPSLGSPVGSTRAGSIGSGFERGRSSPFFVGEGRETERENSSSSKTAGGNVKSHWHELNLGSPISTRPLSPSIGFDKSQQTIRPHPDSDRAHHASSPIQLPRQDFVGEWLTKEKPDSTTIDLRDPSDKEREQGRSSWSTASYRKAQPCSTVLMESVEERDYAILERQRRRDAERKNRRRERREVGDGLDRADGESSDGVDRGRRWWETKRWKTVIGLATVLVALGVTLGILMQKDKGKLSQATLSP